MDYTRDQIDRYARHFVLPELGSAGQAKLLRARVLVIGAGGIGSPVILYLAAAGVGTLGIVDDDTVALSNLQRQVLHAGDRLGQLKTDSAARTVAALNPDVRIEPHAFRLTADRVADLVAAYDLVIDGCDNFPTRFLMADACFFGRRTLISAASIRFDGQLGVYKPHARSAGGGNHPCWRCLFPEQPAAAANVSCATGGILGAVCGVVGSLAAAEAVKEITGIGTSLSGRLWLYDGLAASIRQVRVRPDPACPLCGPLPKWLDLAHHRGGDGGVCAVALPRG